MEYVGSDLGFVDQYEAEVGTQPVNVDRYTSMLAPGEDKIR